MGSSKLVLGSLHLFFGLCAIIVFALLMAFHIKAYHMAVSYYWKPEFLWFDPFSTRLLGLLLLAFLVNAAGGMLSFTGMFSEKRLYQISLLGFACILWSLTTAAMGFLGEYLMLGFLPLSGILALVWAYKSNVSTPTMVVVGLLSVLVFGLGFTD